MTIERTLANAPQLAASTAANQGKEALVAADQASQQVSRTRRTAADAAAPMPRRSASPEAMRPRRTAAPAEALVAVPQPTSKSTRPPTNAAESFRPSNRNHPPTVTYARAAPQAKTSSVSPNGGGSTPRATAASTSQVSAVSAKQMLASFDKLLQQVLGKDFKQPANHAERTQLAGLAVSRLKGAAREKFLAQAESLGRDFGLNFGLSRASAKGRQALNAGVSGRSSGERSAVYNGLANEWRSGSTPSAAPKGKQSTPTPATTTPTTPANNEPAGENRVPGATDNVATLPQGASSATSTDGSAGTDATQANTDSEAQTSTAGAA